MPKAAAVVLGVFCDTGFLTRLNKPADLHAHARACPKFLLEGGQILYDLSGALAVYAVGDQIANLPVKISVWCPLSAERA